jgi:hypothetical protein
VEVQVQVQVELELELELAAEVVTADWRELAEATLAG